MTPRQLTSALLAWYDRHRRRLPWRALPGETPDPYRVWLSEIMLQQTTVATVGPYYEAFLRRWPTVEALAAAPLDDVLHAWQGLGYYARGRHLHRCAREVAAAGGRFPDTEEELRRLPGVGTYTAGAIAAIAFGRAAAAIDGNVKRVIGRLVASAAVEALARALVPADRPGDFAQALMDLGATVCRPRSPDCDACPWCKACKARAEGNPESYPARSPRKPKPTRHGVVYWMVRAGDGAVLVQRRPPEGLLGGMAGFPTGEWREEPWTIAAARAAAPLPADWREVHGRLRHTFTHFHLDLTVLAAQVPARTEPGGLWCPPDRLSDHALPTLMKKVARLALGYSS
ncbi:MAG: A/G-specific adenine glycosylase [Magnetospirillum sp. WYHS-4]